MCNSKVIVFGYNSIAREIVAALKAKRYIVEVIENDPQLIDQAKKDGIEIKNLNLMEDENLIEIGIQQEDIKAFFCVSDDPNVNLFVTLSARNLNKHLRIISLTSTKEDNKKMMLAGANKIINPYEIGGLRIFRLLHKPLILEVLDNILFSESDISVAEITIEKGSALDGIYLRDLNANNLYNLVIVGLQDKELGDDFVFYSSGINHKIDIGDTLVVIGYSNDIKKFQNHISLENVKG